MIKIYYGENLGVYLEGNNSLYDFFYFLKCMVKLLYIMYTKKTSKKTVIKMTKVDLRIMKYLYALTKNLFFARTYISTAELHMKHA